MGDNVRLAGVAKPGAIMYVGSWLSLGTLTMPSGIAPVTEEHAPIGGKGVTVEAGLRSYREVGHSHHSSLGLTKSPHTFGSVG